MRIIDAYRAIDMIDEWLDSVGTVLVGKPLSGYEELIGCIEDTPTLTPPNEPLTCEGCIHEHNEHENCNYCKRASYLGDYYYCRPPEGEQDT